jgi:hypothetical protein
VKLALKWAFQDPKVAAIEAETEPDNRASQRVLEKCGFVPNGKNGKEGPRFSLMPSEQKPDLRIRTAEIEDTARKIKEVLLDESNRELIKSLLEKLEK